MRLKTSDSFGLFQIRLASVVLQLFKAPVYLIVTHVNVGWYHDIDPRDCFGCELVRESRNLYTLQVSETFPIVEEDTPETLDNRRMLESSRPVRLFISGCTPRATHLSPQKDAVLGEVIPCMISR